MKKLITLSATLAAATALALTYNGQGAYSPAIPATATDYVVIEGGVLDICVKNTSSSYQTYSTPLLVTQEHPLAVYTSRYTEFKSPVKGDGPLSLYCGGERTYIGDQKGNTYPDWSQYTGELHVYPWREVETGAGWYGVILNHNGKRFSPEDLEASLQTANSQLINNRMVLHDGATLALPTGTRGVRIGQLDTEAGSRIFGNIKKSSSSTPSAAYFVVGATGADGTLAGVIRSVDDADTPLGIIKEGKGTYRITGNDNIVNGAVRVLDGAVMINNDAQVAQAEKRQGAIGRNPAGTPGVYVFRDGLLGGTGSCGATVDLYGTINPGDNGTGCLTLADYASGSAPSLRLRPASRMVFEIASQQAYDQLVVAGALDYSNIDQDFMTSDLTPIVYLQPTDDCDLQVGDKLVLVSAGSKGLLAGQEWKWRIQYPKQYTWQVAEEQNEDGLSYMLTATVTSLEYSGQGDVNVEDGDTPEDPGEEDDDDGFDETTDSTTLRAYAEQLDRLVGVATSTWRINGFDNDNTPQIKQMYTEFNALVAENEMKFDATEPARGSFNYGDGDRIVNLAQRHGMHVRGHALAWHKQMPTWLSSDGGVKNNNNFSRDELLQILKNHIDNVVGHYRGKVAEWDVVNECLSDDQSAIRNNPQAYDLRPSVWMTGIGEDYIDSAFVYAHRADPNALLILNEYGAEFKGAAKTEALFNLAKRLKDSGIPIDGVGLQCHLDCGSVDAAKLSATIDMYASIGLSCIITELDLGIDSKSAENLEQQRIDYRNIAKVAATNENCRGMIVWGFSDDQSWRSSWPLLFDHGHNRKPAYYGVHAALRRAAGALGIVDADIDAAEAVSTEYYDIQGRRLQHPAPGLSIRVTTHADGTRHSQVVIQ